MRRPGWWRKRQDRSHSSINKRWFSYQVATWSTRQRATAGWHSKRGYPERGRKKGHRYKEKGSNQVVEAAAARCEGVLDRKSLKRECQVVWKNRVLESGALRRSCWKAVRRFWARPATTANGTGQWASRSSRRKWQWGLTEDLKSEARAFGLVNVKGRRE